MVGLGHIGSKMGTGELSPGSQCQCKCAGVLLQPQEQVCAPSQPVREPGRPPAAGLPA